MSDGPPLPEGFAVVGVGGGVLVSVDGDLALTPEQARELARQIVEAADQVAARPGGICGAACPGLETCTCRLAKDHAGRHEGFALGMRQEWDAVGECQEHPGEPCIIGGPYANHAGRSATRP